MSKEQIMTEILSGTRPAPEESSDAIARRPKTLEEWDAVGDKRPLLALQQARWKLLEAEWAAQDAAEALKAARTLARYQLIDAAGGDMKTFGSTVDAQKATLDVRVDSEVSGATDLIEMERITARAHERAKTTLAVLLDEQAAERWAVRRMAVERGVSLGDGAAFS